MQVLRPNVPIEVVLRRSYFKGTPQHERSLQKEGSQQGEEKHQDLALKSQQTEDLSVSEFDHGRKVLGRSPISFSNNDNSPVLRKQIM